MEERARWTPATVPAWRFGRLRTAASWTVHLIVHGLASDRLATLPPPTKGLLSLCGDGSHADTRGTKHPVAQQRRIRQQPPWYVGLRFVLVMAAWDGYCVPGGFCSIMPKRHAASRRAHALLRAMGGECGPPPWTQRVLVGGEAAYGSKTNIRMVQNRDTADPARRWGLVCAIARPWKTGEDKTLTNHTTHVPRQ